jgi:hypothetical protein
MAKIEISYPTKRPDWMRSIRPQRAAIASS